MLIRKGTPVAWLSIELDSELLGRSYTFLIIGKKATYYFLRGKKGNVPRGEQTLYDRFLVEKASL